MRCIDACVKNCIYKIIMVDHSLLDYLDDGLELALGQGEEGLLKSLLELTAHRVAFDREQSFGLLGQGLETGCEDGGLLGFESGLGKGYS